MPMSLVELETLIASLRKHGVRKFAGEVAGTYQTIELELGPEAAPAAPGGRDILGETFPKDILFNATPYAMPDEEPKGTE